MPLSRKVLIRVVGAPLLLAALGAVLYWDYRSGRQTGLRWLLFLVAILGIREFYALCAAKGIVTARGAGTVALGVVYLTPLIPAERAIYAQESLLPLLFMLVLYLLLKLVVRHGNFTPEAAALTVLAYLYLGLLTALDPPPVAGKAASFFLVFLVAANKGADMAAYVVGKTMGRHKMTPVLSPNKTWEGFVGGAVGGTAAGAAILLATPLRGAYPTVPAAALLFLALLVTMAAQVGDLVESAFKRWAGVKDSGRLIPEFGGMLDMVDSFLISAPVAYLGSRLLSHAFSGG